MQVLIAFAIPAIITGLGLAIEWQKSKHKKQVEQRAHQQYKQSRIKQ